MMALSEVRVQVEHLGLLVGRHVRGAPLAPVRFVIFGRGRSGSTTLVSLLDSLPGVRCDDEILHRPVLFPLEHVRAKCAGSRSAAYGCKILSYQVRTVKTRRRREAFVRDLARDGFRILYLTRDNVVQQAVSNIRARQLGFHQSAGRATAVQRVTVDRDDLMHWIEQSLALARFERAALAGVPHLGLTYENDLVLESLHRTTLLRVCDFLDLPRPEGVSLRSQYRKVSPRTLRDSVANYDQLVGFLQGTPYAGYLD